MHPLARAHYPLGALGGSGCGGVFSPFCVVLRQAGRTGIWLTFDHSVVGTGGPSPLTVANGSSMGATDFYLGCCPAPWLVLPDSTFFSGQAAYRNMIVLTVQSQTAAMTVRRWHPFGPPATPKHALLGQDIPHPGRGPNRLSHSNTPVPAVEGL